MRYFLSVRISAWIEIGCFFLICLIIAFIAGTPFNFFSFSPHPFWIIVILISSQYGTSSGLAAALISTLVYLGGPLPKQTILQEANVYFFQIAKMPLLWFVTALILGELRMRHIRETERLRSIVRKTEQRETQFAASYEALKKIKERLEMRVAAEKPTTLLVVEAIKNLEEGDNNHKILQALELVEILINPEKYSLFLLEAGKLVLKEARGWEPSDSYAKVFDNDTSLFKEIVEDKKALSLTKGDLDSLGKEGMIAVPFCASTDATIGMFKIEQMPFQQIRVSTLESLELVGMLLGKAYGR